MTADSGRENGFLPEGATASADADSAGWLALSPDTLTPASGGARMNERGIEAVVEHLALRSIASTEESMEPGLFESRVRLGRPSPVRFAGSSLLPQTSELLLLSRESRSDIVYTTLGDGEIYPRQCPPFRGIEVGRAIRWEVDPAVWRQHACAIAGGPTPEEWDEIAPGHDYISVCPSGLTADRLAPQTAPAREWPTPRPAMYPECTAVSEPSRCQPAPSLASTGGQAEGHDTKEARNEGTRKKRTDG